MTKHFDRGLIINADGYGIERGVNDAIEECIEFGTVSSISSNVNFPLSTELPDLLKKFPRLSVGCHLNPVIGKPVLPPDKIPSLVNATGEFHYHEFDRKLNSGWIVLRELESELLAQVQRCRDLAGHAFSHIDCHMGKHRLPFFYPTFLRVVKASRVGRIRTHRYRIVMESSNQFRGTLSYYSSHPMRLTIYAWNVLLRVWAIAQGLLMPDWWLSIGDMGSRPETISVTTWCEMLQNVPLGVSEFVVHPAYVVEGSSTWTNYLWQREKEREVLCSDAFRSSLISSGVRLLTYRDIPLHHNR